MTERKATTRIELADDEMAAVLAEVPTGRRLSRRAERQLAATLRQAANGVAATTVTRTTRHSLRQSLARQTRLLRAMLA